MERLRTGSPVYGRQQSNSSSSGMPASPTTAGAASPLYPHHLSHRHVRSGSAGGPANFRRAQNTAARAAAQRLARVMAHQPADDESGSDEDATAPPIELLSTPRRAARSPSPALGRYLAEQTPVRPTSTGRPSVVAKPATLIPPIKPMPRPVITTMAIDSPVKSVRTESPFINRRDKRMSVDLGSLNMREPVHPRSSSALEDEIDVLQDENESLLQKLRLAEERTEEAEEKARQLEKQVASVGEGISVEARLLSRKEAAIQKREADLRAAQEKSKNKDIAALQVKAKIARDEAASAADHLNVAEAEVKSLKALAQKMILSQEEMEEIILKRCWLARYWKLCVQYGIHADIAEMKHEYWSSFSPLPLEVVLSAGQKATEGLSGYVDKMELMKQDRGSPSINDTAGEDNIESMLLVEKGLRELSSLKVEEAVLLAMAQHRCASIKTGQSHSGPLFPAEGQNPAEAFELSQEEKEDVLFKQAWLTYFWRRVKNHGLEEDIADERLQFWIEQRNHSPTSLDAIEVERGLFEFKKLGIELQVWEASRRAIEEDASHQGSQNGSEI